jgi:hypothetical protein
MSNDSYASFLAAIARELPCPVANLIESKISWKPQKPVNAPTLPLGNGGGVQREENRPSGIFVDASTNEACQRETGVFHNHFLVAQR